MKTYDKHIRETGTIPSYHPFVFGVQNFGLFLLENSMFLLKILPNLELKKEVIAIFLYMVQLLRPKIHKDI